MSILPTILRRRGRGARRKNGKSGLLPLNALFAAAIALGVLPSACQNQTVTLRYGGYAQFEISSPEGQRVITDLWTTAYVRLPITENDILLTSHTNNWDHFNRPFAQYFHGRELRQEAGLIETADVRITGIDSFHGEPGEELYGPNVIFLIETGGLRIVQLGGFGQVDFTAEQLAALGRVDVLLAPVSDESWDEAGPLPNRFLGWVERLAPRIAIPTRMEENMARSIAENRTVYAAGGEITLTPSSLPDETTILFMDPPGMMDQPGISFQELLGIPAWPGASAR